VLLKFSTGTKTNIRISVLKIHYYTGSTGTLVLNLVSLTLVLTLVLVLLTLVLI
jgi:hypothetical protein